MQSRDICMCVYGKNEISGPEWGSGGQKIAPQYDSGFKSIFAAWKQTPAVPTADGS